MRRRPYSLFESIIATPYALAGLLPLRAFWWRRRGHGNGDGGCLSQSVHKMTMGGLSIGQAWGPLPKGGFLPVSRHSAIV